MWAVLASGHRGQPDGGQVSVLTAHRKRLAGNNGCLVRGSAASFIQSNSCCFNSAQSTGGSRSATAWLRTFPLVCHRNGINVRACPDLNTRCVTRLLGEWAHGVRKWDRTGQANSKCQQSTTTSSVDRYPQSKGDAQSPTPSQPPDLQNMCRNSTNAGGADWMMGHTDRRPA